MFFRQLSICTTLGTTDIDFRNKSFYIKIDSSIFACVLLLFSIMYFTINFLSIQKLNDEIFDRITEEQEQK